MFCLFCEPSFLIQNYYVHYYLQDAYVTKKGLLIILHILIHGKDNYMEIVIERFIEYFYLIITLKYILSIIIGDH